MSGPAVEALRRRPTLVILFGRASYQLGQFVLIVAPSLSLSDAGYEELVVMYTTTSILVLAALIALHTSILRSARGGVAASHPSAACFLIAVPLSVVSIGVSLAFGVTGMEGVIATLGFAAAAACNGDILLRSSLAARAGRPFRSGVIELSTGAALVAVVVALTIAEADDAIAWSMAYAAASVACAVTTRLGRAGDLVDAPLTGRRASALDAAKAILADGRLLLVTGLLMAAFNRADFLVMSVLASDQESARYALATRFAGPALVGLSALNNSMFIRQLERRDDLAALTEYTRSAIPRLVRVTVAVCAVALVGVVVVGVFSDSLADRDLLLPSALLLLATCVFSASVPWAYALNAIGREGLWMRIVAATLVVDAVAVAIGGYRNAVACAACWLGTQAVVFVALGVARRRSGLAARRMAT